MTTMTTPAKVVVGIDVGKRCLEASADGGAVQSFGNDDAGIGKLMGWLATQPVALVVCEPTGGYEGRLVDQLRGVGCVVHLAHPNKVRAFAQASGRLAKTDRIDAQALSHYGRVFAVSEDPEPGPEPERAEVQALLRRRRQLVNQRVQELNRMDRARNAAARASTQRHIAWLDEEIDRLDEEYRKALQSSAVLTQQAKLYRSVPGVGELTAATLVAHLPELGQGDGRGLCSLVGLAPWSRDSGQQRGYRAIRGGRGEVRQALYMAALSSGRVEGPLRQFHQGLRRRGKAGKVALVAVMRKLLLQLHAVARRGTPWTANHATAS